MAQITRLAKTIQGAIKNQALDLNELVVDSITLGGTSGTNLSQTELDTLLAQTHAPESDNQNIQAGMGLAGGGAGSTVTLDVVAADASLTVNSDDMSVKRDAAGAVGLGVNGLTVNTDDSTIEKDTNALRVKDLGITTAKIADDAVDTNKLRSDPTVDANRAVSTNHIRDTAITAAKLDSAIAGDGLYGGAGSALSVNVDGATIDIITDTLGVKDAGITETQLSASVAGDGLTGGAGSPLAIGEGNGIQVDTDSIQVLHAPANKIDVVAGESFAANTTFLVRLALTGETAGRVYKANALNALDKKYLVLGLLLSTGGLAAGDPGTLLLNGSHTLGSSDTVFNVADVGKEVYLRSDGSGRYTLSPPDEVGAAQFRVGIVQSTTQIMVDLKELVTVVPEPQYDERIQYPAGLASGTDITLPDNSRNNDEPQTYDSNEGRLQVYLNQLLKFQDIDWVPGTDPTTQIKFNYDLPVDTEVHFRLDALASGVLSNALGATPDLQDVYDAGNTITISPGLPLTINGPAEKLLVINGDIEVTGIIDPTAIQLSGQSSNPLGAGQMGIWIDTSGALMHEDGVNPGMNVSQILTEVQDGTAISYIAKSYANNSGVTIPPFTPVYSPIAGEIAMADGYDLNKYRVIGITVDNIVHGASGLVAMTGILPGISAVHNRYLYLGPTPGSVVDTGPTLGGYSAGFNVVRLGSVEGTNLILQVQHMGTL